MLPVLRYILLTAIRDRLYIGLFFILTIAFGISVILGQTSLVEGVQTSIVYVAGSARMIFTVGMILFTCFYVRKSFDNKEVEFILSKSVSRFSLICAYLAGFVVVAIFVFIPITVVLLLVKANKIGLIFWLLTILFEIFILIAFAVLSSLILRSAVSAVLATLGFYILSRMMAFFVLTIHLPQSSADFSTWKVGLDSFLKVLSLIFPRLDLFAKSEWLIYGINDYKILAIILVQSLIYIPLMTFMSFFDFGKKQF